MHIMIALEKVKRKIKNREKNNAKDGRKRKVRMKREIIGK